MAITAKEVNQLRQMTGAGMMDCKKALTEANGNMETATEVLRKRGIAVAAKKAGRVAADGTIGYYFSDDAKLGVLVEINCETDFVTKTPDFQNYVVLITDIIKSQKPNDMEGLMSLPHNGSELKNMETDLVAKIGEKLGTRRFVRWEAEDNKTKLSQYIHAGNKIGVMVEFSDPSGKLTDKTAKEVAMHVAAMSPQYVKKDDIPESVIAKEREIFISQMVDQKKPKEILEKIAEGKLNKFYSEACLDNQLFVCDPNGKASVKDALKAIDKDIEINKFVRIQVGEGIEKKA